MVVLHSTQKPRERGGNRTRTAHRHCHYIRPNNVQFSCARGSGLRARELGRERKGFPPVSRAGPEATGSARSCLKAVLRWGQRGCLLQPGLLKAAVEHQLVPTDGKGFKKESVTQEKGRNLLEECVKTSSSFHMQVLCWFSYSYFYGNAVNGQIVLCCNYLSACK